MRLPDLKLYGLIYPFILLFLVLVSCSGKPRDTLQKSLDAIESIKSVEYQLINYHDRESQNSIEIILIKPDEEARLLYYDGSPVLYVVNDFFPFNHRIENERYKGLFYNIANLIYIALNFEEYQKTDSLFDKCSIDNVRDTIRIVAESTPHNLVFNYSFLFTDDLPTYIRQTVLIDNETREELEFDIKYLRINNIPHTIIAEYEEQIKLNEQESTRRYVENKLLNTDLIHLYGQIGDYPIRMTLNLTEDNLVKGTYYYNKKRDCY